VIEGALIFLGGLVAGVITRSLPARKKPTAQLAAVCPCRHARSFHADGTGRCHGKDRLARYNDAGLRIGYEPIDCSCQRYDGPQPFQELYAPPLQLPPD
jgi:hypothetical protein